MGRKLGYFESAAAFSSDRSVFYFVSVLALKNAPPPEVIDQALKLLQVRQPFLRVKIHSQNNQYTFDDANVPPIELQTSLRVDDQSWITVAEQALNSSLDWRAGPLLEVTHVYEPTSPYSELVFKFHHAIIDATSAVAFFDELLQLCSRLERKEDVAVGAAQSFPQAVEVHFPPSFQGLSLRLHTVGFVLRMMLAELSFMIKTRNQRKAPIRQPSKNRILTLHLDRKQTGALERRVRAEQLTLNSALHAALVRAVWLHCYHGEPVQLKFMFFQNLRPLLQPPVPERTLGFFVAMLQEFAQLNSEQSFWELAQAINQRIYKSAKSGDKYCAVAFSDRLMRTLFQLRKMRMASTALNYSGAISLAKMYGDIERLAVHGFVSNFELGPEYTAQAAILDEQLDWNIVYLEGDMDAVKAQLLADEIRKQLLEAS